MNKYKINLLTENEATIYGVKFEGFKSRLMNYLAGVSFALNSVRFEKTFNITFCNNQFIQFECSDNFFVLGLATELSNFGVKIIPDNN